MHRIESRYKKGSSFDCYDNTTHDTTRTTHTHTRHTKQRKR
jgi:hypothetical protein